MSTRNKLSDRIKAKFINPTEDEAFDTDPTGLTGITTNSHDVSEGSLSEDASLQDSTSGLSDAQAHNNEVNAADPGEDSQPQMNQDIRANNPQDQVDLRDSTGNDTLNEATGDDVAGEQSVSGSDPDPGSDDDVLKNAQDIGIGLDEDPEHPQELDIAGDIDKAEEYHRRH